MILRLALAALLFLATTARADDEASEARQRAVEAELRARQRAVEIEARARHREQLRAESRAEGRADSGDEMTTDTTVSVPPRARLTLEDFGGSIVIRGWNRNAVRVRAQHEAGTEIGVEVGPATVRVDATRILRLPGLQRTRRLRVQRIELPATVDYDLMVPRWMDLRLTGVTTDIAVAGVENEVIAETVTGSVSLHGGKGNIRLNSMNGGVELVGARALLGPIELGAVEGDIVVRDVIGPIRAEAVNGDVDLLRVESDDVEASTVTGDVSYAGSFNEGGNYRFSSHSGDLVVMLPERPDMTISVDTFNGEFESDFPVKLSEMRRGKQFSFTLGEGRADVGLKSFSGTIRLVRKAPPAPPTRSPRPAPPRRPVPPVEPVAPVRPGK